jgi:Ala-tRNA(Pro) deacylase
MSIAYRVQDYIADRRVPWDPVSHGTSTSCMGLAHLAHVPPDHVAKAVILEGEAGIAMMAVIPASQRLDLEAMGEHLADDLALVAEDRLPQMFPDCAPGAIPPVGEAYGIRTMWDPHLGDWNDVWFEGGDHRTLVHMKGADFASLMRFARALPRMH